MLKNHLQQIENGITYYSRTYENFIVKEDFNAEIFDTSICSFCVIHNFKSLIKESTCYKNPDNPACIDLILANRWIPNPGVPCSKPLSGSKVDSAFHPSEADQMSIGNFWEVSSKK